VKRPALVLTAILAVTSTSIHPSEKVGDRRKSSVAEMVQEFSSLGIHKLYIPDFCDAASRPDDRGAFFAGVFSDLLAHKAHVFTVVSRADVHRFLVRSNSTDCDLQNPAILSSVSSEFGIDSVLSATLAADKNSYRLDFVLRDVSGKELSRIQHVEPRVAETEALFPATAAASGWPFYFLMFDGVKVGRCLKCPNPPYPESLRKERISGVVALSGRVTTEGGLDQLRVVKQLQPDLDRLSLETLNTWRLEPAKGPDGTPVPVRTIFEVNFSIF